MRHIAGTVGKEIDYFGYDLHSSFYYKKLFKKEYGKNLEMVR
jgi:hypothetical protein